MGASGAISRLYIANANKKDSGNYSCALADVAAATTVSVHVLNGTFVSGQHSITFEPLYSLLHTTFYRLLFFSLNTNSLDPFSNWLTPAFHTLASKLLIHPDVMHNNFINFLYFLFSEHCEMYTLSY